MNKKIMIVITGAAGFIGSCLLSHFNQHGVNDCIIVDDFSVEAKKPNYFSKHYSLQIERKEFISWFESNSEKVEFVFHIGARTDTTEFNKTILDELNLDYTKSIWNICTKFNIPLVYASSAATYGLGEFGYEDKHELSEKLKPLNPYGESKNDFDIWALKHEKTPPNWYGLKFFNVYGPNEFHKGRMASVIFHAYHQILEKNEMKLFRSHNPDYKDGEQLRDFVYVKDVLKVCQFLFDQKPRNGIYNLGSGKARTFKDLVINTFSALNKDSKISFIDTPEDIRDKYQYFTEANMQKLVNQGYTEDFYTLEEGINDYVKNYLVKNTYF